MTVLLNIMQMGYWQNWVLYLHVLMDDEFPDEELDLIITRNNIKWTPK